MGDSQHTFTCAICRHVVERHAYQHGRRIEVAPVCGRCERDYGHRPPQAGSFRDRRKVAQISALAETLHSEALMQKWSARRGRA